MEKSINKSYKKKLLEELKPIDKTHLHLAKEYLNNRQISDILNNSMTNYKELAELCVFGLNKNSKRNKFMIKKYKVCKNNGINDIWKILKVCCENYISEEIELCKINLNSKLKIELFKTY